MASYKTLEAGPSHSDGLQVGNAVTDKVGLFGVTPVVQPAGANQIAITDNSGGTGTDTLLAVEASYTQATLQDNFATLADKVNDIRQDLIDLGIIKGAA